MIASWKSQPTFAFWLIKISVYPWDYKFRFEWQKKPGEITKSC